MDRIDVLAIASLFGVMAIVCFAMALRAGRKAREYLDKGNAEMRKAFALLRNEMPPSSSKLQPPG